MFKLFLASIFILILSNYIYFSAEDKKIEELDVETVKIVTKERNKALPKEELIKEEVKLGVSSIVPYKDIDDDDKNKVDLKRYKDLIKEVKSMALKGNYSISEIEEIFYNEGFDVEVLETSIGNYSFSLRNSEVNALDEDQIDEVSNVLSSRVRDEEVIVDDDFERPDDVFVD